MVFNQAVVALLPLVPRPIVWRFSRRYIAGTSLEAALDLVQGLNDQGMCATLDLLGEDVTERDPAIASRDMYLRAIEGITARGLDCNASIKLSQMALRFDDALCREIVWSLAEATSKVDNFLRIDMEDSSVTDATLDIYRALREEHPASGTVIQACLKRSAADVDALMAESAAPTHIRVCKGIYVEPPEIAYQGREEVRDSFNDIVQRLLRGNAARVAIATHDPPLIESTRRWIESEGIDRDRVEYQMLLGVGESLRKPLLDAGYRLRIYVPFGEAWFAYSHRRLRENPQIAGHIVRNLFRPG